MSVRGKRQVIAAIVLTLIEVAAALAASRSAAQARVGGPDGEE